jgi:hypothetical protein
LRKGVVFAGFSGGASLRESENENALVVTIQDQSKKGYNLIFAGGYILKPELAVGVGIRYDQSRTSKAVMDSDGITSNIQEAGSILTSSVYVKNFIPLTLYTRKSSKQYADKSRDSEHRDHGKCGSSTYFIEDR